MTLRCIAIDDEPLALDLIGNYISQIPLLELAGTFENALSAIEYLNKNNVDILLVDVNMPDINGVELVKSLNKDIIVIFTTAYRQFAYEGFELSATDYLVKPISFERFEKAIQKAFGIYHYKKSVLQTNTAEHIYVYSEYEMIKVDLTEIEYIEGMEDYIRIHCINKKPIMTLMSLKKIMEKLPQNRFKRIHRSYIIDTHKIVSIKNKKVNMQSIELPIGSSYMQEVKLWLYR